MENPLLDNQDPRRQAYAQFYAAEVIRHIAEEQLKAGDYEKAISSHNIAMSLGAFGALIAGKHLVETGSWQHGAQLLRMTRDLFSGIGSWEGQAQAAIEIGDAHLLLGDYEVAQMSYLDAQRYLRKIDDEAGLAVTQQKLGTLALFMYNVDEAERELNEALTFFESHGDQKRAEISRKLLQLAPEVRQEILA